MQIQKKHVLPTIPEGINKNLIVLDSNGTDSATKLKRTLNKETNTTENGN